MRVNYNISDNADSEDIVMGWVMKVLILINVVNGILTLTVIGLGIALLSHLSKVQFILEWLSR